jgi:hypothetical protein
VLVSISVAVLKELGYSLLFIFTFFVDLWREKCFDGCFSDCSVLYLPYFTYKIIFIWLGLEAVASGGLLTCDNVAVNSLPIHMILANYF